MSSSAHTKFSHRYGPWAVVTGASSGIGRACAEELARRGINVVLVARREAELRKLAASLSPEAVETRIVSVDLSAPAGLAAVETATADLDVGLLVAAAGFGTSGPFLDAEVADEVNLLDLNCRSVLWQTHHFGRRLVARGRGGMILFGSLVGFQGAPWAANYAASKAYVQSLGEGLHIELRPRGVDVLVAAPGPVHSGFGERARMTLGAADRPAAVAKAVMSALGSGMTVTPGVFGKLLTWSLMTAPRSLRTRIMAKIMSGMARR